MVYKSGEVISDQFEPLKMFSFLENSGNGYRGGLGSPIPTSLFQFVTKNQMCSQGPQSSVLCPRSLVLGFKSFLLQETQFTTFLLLMSKKS